MVQAVDECDKYILLSEVANRCSSLAEKWNYIVNEKKRGNCSLEDELIRRAFLQQLHLYCFTFVEPTLSGLGKKWFFIWSDHLQFFLNPQSIIDCNLFLVNSRDRIKFDRNYDSKPRIIKIRRSDLYLNLDELKSIEENDEDFADLVIAGPNLPREEMKIEKNSTGDEQDISNSTDTRKETSNMPTIDLPNELTPNINDSSLAFSHGPDLKVVATVENQPPLNSEIVQKNRSLAQAEKPKSTKLTNKKKDKQFLRHINTVAETVELAPLSKDDKEPIPLKTFAELQTRTLSLDEIIGNREKGIPAIIPVSKSTWYAGLKSGRYPKSFEVSEGRVAWRGSDIYALLQQMGMV